MTADNPSGSLAEAPVAELRGVWVETPQGEPIVEGVSLSLGRGETLGLVGESGSGKTTMALSLLGYSQGGARITSGEVVLGGEAVPASSEKAMRRLRGSRVTYVPQNPGTALNPSMRVGDTIAEMLRQHRSGAVAPDAIEGRLTGVGLPGTPDFQERYPHQLSGGQQQRVCISVAVACEPPIVVLDEPTTGLDVVTQATILSELLRLRGEHGISMIYVAHDLAVVAQIADRIAVMYAGRIVEEGPAREILRRPKHPYTQGLLSSIPDHIHPRALHPMAGVAVQVGDRPPGCSFAPRCPLAIEQCTTVMPELRTVGSSHSARCIRSEEVSNPASRPPPQKRADLLAQQTVLKVSHLRAEHAGRGGTVVAARDVSFAIRHGECVALVGESGSGKTTIARAITGLHPRAAGEIELHGQLLPETVRGRTWEQRRGVQMIFQNPSDALNPRHTISQAVARPVQLLQGLKGDAVDAEVARLFELVRLPAGLARRYPADLSGGERQRVGVARALAAKPQVIVCDEVTSALDVSVQAAVLNLLSELRAELGLSLLFITHDLGVVAAVADSVLVLDRGDVCEAGPVSEILRAPQHEYTRRLLSAAPSISTSLEDWAKAEATTGLEAS